MIDTRIERDEAGTSSGVSDSVTATAFAARGPAGCRGHVEGPEVWTGASKQTGEAPVVPGNEIDTSPPVPLPCRGGGVRNNTSDQRTLTSPDLRPPSPQSGEGRGGSRLPLERAMQIDRLLQAKQFPNCATLAAKFEVTRRTIKRDIEFLKERVGRPVVYDSRRGGYCYTKPVEPLETMKVSDHELFSLVMAYKAVAQFRRTPFQAPLESALRKVAGEREDARQTLNGFDQVMSFRPFAPAESDGEALEVLTTAIQNRTAVGFSYRKVGAEAATKRRVHPYHVACIGGQFYLLAFDLARRAIRTFVVARLQEIAVLEERFTIPGSFDAAEYLRGSFGAFNGTEDYRVVIEFDAWAADLIRGRQWHGTQKITERAEGGIRFEVRLNSLEEIERWVLSWGAHAMVLKPAALCNRVHEAVAELNGRYLEQLKEEFARPVPVRGGK